MGGPGRLAGPGASGDVRQSLYRFMGGFSCGDRAQSSHERVGHPRPWPSWPAARRTRGCSMSFSLLEKLHEQFPRVAVIHEWLTIPGGSEQVVLELLEMFPQAELFTSIYDPAPWPAQ